MDIDNLLKTVVKAKSGFLMKRQKILSTGKNIKNQVDCDSIPHSLTQLLKKYSPRNSPIILKQNFKYKILQGLKLLESLQQKTTKKSWKNWKLFVFRATSKEKAKLIQSPKYKLIKSKTSRSPYIQKVKPAIKSNNIVKIESTIKMASLFKSLHQNILQKVFLLFKTLKFHNNLSKILKPIFRKFFSNAKGNFFLSISRNECISIVPKVQKPKNYSIMTENSFDFFPSRNNFQALSVNYRYSGNVIFDSQVLTSDLSPRQSLILQKLSSPKSFLSESSEFNPLDISQEKVSIRSSVNNSVNLVKDDDSIVETGCKEENFFCENFSNKNEVHWEDFRCFVKEKKSFKDFDGEASGNEESIEELVCFEMAESIDIQRARDKFLNNGKIEKSYEKNRKKIGKYGKTEENVKLAKKIQEFFEKIYLRYGFSLVKIRIRNTKFFFLLTQYTRAALQMYFLQLIYKNFNLNQLPSKANKFQLSVKNIIKIFNFSQTKKLFLTWAKPPKAQKSSKSLKLIKKYSPKTLEKLSKTFSTHSLNKCISLITPLKKLQIPPKKLAFSILKAKTSPKLLIQSTSLSFLSRSIKALQLKKLKFAFEYLIINKYYCVN